MRVLIIDDDIELCALLREFLEREGYRVTLEVEGLRGLELATGGNFDLVVLDLMLPGMDGFAVAAALRREPALARTRLIAVSGYPPESAPCRRPATFDRHLVKPVALEELHSVLQAYRRSSTA